MNKINDSTIVLFLFFLLVCISVLQMNNPIQNKGIVEFGDFNKDLMGCDPSMTISEGCYNPVQWGNGDVYTNKMISSDNALISSSDVSLKILKTEDYDTVLKQKNVKEEKEKESFSEFAAQLYLPSDKNTDNINITNNVDMREVSIDTWRKETNDKNNKLILSDLRSYQDEYNQLEKNDFKSMSIEEHRKQNIKEWEAKIRENTNNQLENI